jgi:hypothetical protein
MDAMTEADVERVFRVLYDWKLANPAFLNGVELSVVAVHHAMARYDAVIRAGGDMERRVFLGSHIDLTSPYKSALFLRLLAGKHPLRYAPPTSFSNPHYALIEAPGPISAVVRGPVPLGGMADRAGGAHGQYWFSVNNCFFACTKDNESAREINARLMSEEPSHFPARLGSLAQEAWWELRYGVWPAWILAFDPDNEARQYRPGWVLRKSAEWDGYSIEYFDL